MAMKVSQMIRQAEGNMVPVGSPPIGWISSSLIFHPSKELQHTKATVFNGPKAVGEMRAFLRRLNVDSADIESALKKL